MLAALATLAAGFVPFVAFALWTNTFSVHSKVTVPLVLSPSILIGDSILIPWFNSKAIPIIWNAIRTSMPTQAKIQLAVWGIATILLSFTINIHLHVLWTKDAYTGFIDPELGHLSIGGEWHCVFASTQMAIVLWFLVFCFTFRRDEMRIRRAEVLSAWRIFTIYTSMSVADVLVMIFVVGRQPSAMSTPDYFALAPVILAAGVYVAFFRLIRMQVS
jgi:hypothetical protein